MNAEELFVAALTHVESAGIREWATSPTSRPLFVELAGKAIEKKGPTSDPVRFATYIVCLAIGLV